MVDVNVNKKEYSDRITNIRALAISLVVFGHSIILYSSSWNLYETSVESLLFDNIKRLINVIQMPLFFSISGFLFYSTHQKHRGWKYLVVNKANRLLIPYLSVAFLYMIPIRLLISFPGYQGMTIPDIVQTIILDYNNGHLWFLPALFMMFVISEGIISFIEKIPIVRNNTEILYLVVSVILYYRGYIFCFGYPALLGVCTYLLWFSFGYFLCRYRLCLYAHNTCITKLMLFVIGCILLYICAFYNIGVMPEIICRYLILFCIYFCSPSSGVNNPIKSIAKNSFGIYLFHSPLIYITFTYLRECNPVIVVFINYMVCGLLAYQLTNIIRRTPIKRIIGE